MNSVMRTMTRAGNRIGVWVYRRSGGRIGGKGHGGVPVLLLTVTGRRTGTPHTVPVACLEHDAGYLVIGSGSGSKRDPQWFRNLEAAGTARVQVRERRFDIDAHIIRGAERDELWQGVVLPRAPHYGKYQRKLARVIPLALLSRQPIE